MDGAGMPTTETGDAHHRPRKRTARFAAPLRRARCGAGAFGGGSPPPGTRRDAVRRSYISRAGRRTSGLKSRRVLKLADIRARCRHSPGPSGLDIPRPREEDRCRSRGAPIGG